MNKVNISIFLASFLILLSACAPQSLEQDARLSIVATTSILGDVVQEIAGEDANVHVLIPAGSDPHSYEATPGDIARVAAADIVFVNGLGLEEFLEELIRRAEGGAKLVIVSEEVEALEGYEEDGAIGQDPHVWMNPQNVVIWVERMVEALAEADAQNKAAYEMRAESYRANLRELDEWAQMEIEGIPEAQRKMVTDHDALAYFAARYDVEVIGAIFPSYSSLGEVSAAELAALEESIRAFSVRAVFVGNGVNPNLAERVADDTGIALVPIYTGALSAPDGPAPSYLEMMRYNVRAIVAALR